VVLSDHISDTNFLPPGAFLSGQGRIVSGLFVVKQHNSCNSDLVSHWAITSLEGTRSPTGLSFIQATPDRTSMMPFDSESPK
jgi:hypothetical protein